MERQSADGEFEEHAGYAASGGDGYPLSRAAVVTDVGTPLSHAAIVARELGIPAVVGCGNATARLKTGDRVCLDGAKGAIDLLVEG